MRFSIVIPSWNRPRRLQQCLDAISQQSYPRNKFETIVVDDGSDPPLEDAVPAETLAGGLTWRFLRQQNTGPARARNLGAWEARGEYLAFLDDDCVPHPDWLEEMDKAAQSYPEDLLGGGVLNGCPENLYASVNQQLVDSVTDWLSQAQSPIAFCTTNNMAVSKPAFKQAGGFNEAFPSAAGEDREFCARWLSSGGRIRRVSAAQVVHYHPQTLRTFARMHFRYGKGSDLFHRSRHTSPARQFSPGLYRHLLKPYWRGTGPSANRFAGAALLVLSQGITALGYVTARLGRNQVLTGPARQTDTARR